VDRHKTREAPLAVVVRAVVFDYSEEFTSRASVHATGLAKWLGAPDSGGEGVEIVHRVLRIRRVGLVVKKLPSSRVYIHWEPVARLTGIGQRLCRFHEGASLAPEDQVYCVRRAEAPSGFCNEHVRSPLALYEKCSAGDDEACLKVSTAWPREAYTIYVLDYGSERVKVGMTRSWRLIWRAAEQPHVAVAAVKTIVGDAYAARVFERELARHRLATEGAGVRVHDRLIIAASFLERYGVARIADRMAEHLAKLGLRGVFNTYTIMPRTGLRDFISARRVKVEALLGRRLVLVDYWAGLLLLEDLDTGERLVVAKSDIQHLALYTARD
jgi:hypothetical protein